MFVVCYVSCWLFVVSCVGGWSLVRMSVVMLCYSLIVVCDCVLYGSCYVLCVVMC